MAAKPAPMPARAATVLVLSVWGLVACGGDEPLTRAELASKGNAICAEVGRRVDEVGEQEGFSEASEPTPEQMQRYVRRVLVVVDDAIADFRRLEPPEDLEAKYDDAVAQAGKDRDGLAAAGESPEKAKQLFDGGEDPFARTNQKLAAVGITECSDEDDRGEQGAATTPDPGAQQLVFNAGEYAFAGPATARPGKVAFVLRNQGREPHELGVVKLKAGVTAHQVIQAGDAGRKLLEDDDVGRIPPVDPGATGVLNLELEPGVYAYACFVTGPDSQPHALKGMYGQVEAKG